MTDNDWSLSQAVCSFIVGLAALWLLMPFLESRYRIVDVLEGAAGIGWVQPAGLCPHAAGGQQRLA